MCAWLPAPPRRPRPPSSWECRCPRSRSAWSISRRRGAPPPTTRSPRSGRSSIRGGERLGSFQSLVNPRRSIPPYIAHLTGIDDRLVSCEPPIEQVLPAFLEFFTGSVFAAHNARFDFGFLDASCDELAYPSLPGPPVCTARLARRVVWPDVPNVKLRTLANYFRTRATPTHRALDDAAGVRRGAARPARPRRSTRHRRRSGDLARGGASPGTSELRQDPARRPPAARARRVPVPWPRRPGAVRGQVQRPSIAREVLLLRRRAQEDRWTCSTRSARSRASGAAASSRRSSWRPASSASTSRSTTGGERPGVAAPTWPSTRPRLGLGSRSCASPMAATAVSTSAHSPARLTRGSRRRPSRRPCPSDAARRRWASPTRFAPCALADMGRCVAPCDGRTDLERYGELVRWLASSLSTGPGELLEALERRMSTLADAERFEEAASVRDRLHALAEGLRRSRSDAWLIGAGGSTCAMATIEVLTFDRGSTVGARRRLRGRGDRRAAVPRTRRRARGGALVDRGAPSAGRRVRGSRPPSRWTGGAALVPRARGAPAADAACAAAAKGRRRAASRLTAWSGRSSSRAREPRSAGSWAPSPRHRRSSSASSQRRRGPASRRRRARPGRADDLRPRAPGGNGPNTGRQVSDPRRRARGGRRLQRQHRLRLGHEGDPARRPADLLGETRGRARRRHGEHDPRAVPACPTCGSGTGSATPTVVDAMYRDGLLDPLCGLIMGETAENLVDMYDISRAGAGRVRAGVAAQGRGRRGAPGRGDVPGRGDDRAARR